MRKERKILRFVPQKLRKSFANGNPSRKEWEAWKGEGARKKYEMGKMMGGGSTRKHKVEGLKEK